VLPDFSGKLYPSHGGGGRSHPPAKKGKTVLFKIKVFVEVNFEVQVAK
jgi:hypothetical protein